MARPYRYESYEFCSLPWYSWHKYESIPQPDKPKNWKVSRGGNTAWDPKDLFCFFCRKVSGFLGELDIRWLSCVLILFLFFTFFWAQKLSLFPLEIPTLLPTKTGCFAFSSATKKLRHKPSPFHPVPCMTLARIFPVKNQRRIRTIRRWSLPKSAMFLFYQKKEPSPRTIC